MSINTRTVEHEQDGKQFEGRLVFDDDLPQPQPCVLVFHGAEGRSEAQEGVARMLTEWGYAGFAVDLFGKGVRGKTLEECLAQMAPLMENRAMLRERLLHTVEVVRRLPEVDSNNLAAIGFCFGGLCVLDLARAGAPLKGVASFHGLFKPSGLPFITTSMPKVIAFHGWDDPWVPPSDVVELGAEFTAAGLDWQLHAYGGTMHAFMAESADNPERGILYNARSAGRAWESLRRFLAETLSERAEDPPRFGVVPQLTKR
jgi:dienelactone hydrolase